MKYGIQTLDDKGEWQTIWFPDFDCAWHDFIVSIGHIDELITLGILSRNYATNIIPRFVWEVE